MNSRSIVCVFLVCVCLCAATAGHAEILVLSGGTLIDGNGGAPVTDAAIVIEGKFIRYAGPRTQIIVPPGARVIDTSGCWILPGLINAHVHGGRFPANRRAWAFDGVTTIRDLGTGASLIFPAHSAAGDDPNLARLVAAGPLVTAPDGYPIAIFNVRSSSLEVFSHEDARAKVEALLDQGADIIKVAAESAGNSIPVLDGDTIALISRIAHGRGTRLSVHITTMHDFYRAVDHGADDLAHMVYGSDFTSAHARLVIDRGIHWVPTLELWEGVGAVQLSEALINLRTFIQAGGADFIALGTDFNGYDSPFELGLPMREMELMREAGMTPMQIIVSATRIAAKVCNLERRLGTIERGKIADILVVRADPLADLHNLRSVRLVLHDGVIIRDGNTATTPSPLSPTVDLLRPDPAGPILAFTDALLIDGSGAAPVADACVITQGQRILCAGPQSIIELPTRARRFLLNGRAVMPGMINASHCRIPKPSELQTLSCYGVTSIRVSGCDERALSRLVRLDRRKKSFPRIVASGPVITAQNGFPVNLPEIAECGIAIGSANKAGKKADSLVSSGAGIIALSFARADESGRILPAPGDVLVSYVLRVARARGVPVSAHAFSVEDARRAARSGATDMPVPGDRHARPSDLRECLVSGITFVSCLATSAAEMDGKSHHAANLAAYLSAGGAVALGTGRLGSAETEAGWSPLEEILSLRDAGLTPMEIIVAATTAAARVCGLEGITGRLANGLEADFIVLDGNPLTKLRLLGQPWMVVVRGEPLSYAGLPLLQQRHPAGSGGSGEGEAAAALEAVHFSRFLVAAPLHEGDQR